jgi:hypothetical protein
VNKPSTTQKLLILAVAWFLLGGGFGVSAGSRYLLLVRESAQDTPKLKAMLTDLRAGKGHEYLKSKGHTLRVADVDDKDENGNPDKELAKYAPYKDRELLIIAPPNKLLSRQPLPDTTDGVISALKSKGG